MAILSEVVGWTQRLGAHPALVRPDAKRSRLFYRQRFSE
jgi:hypothetical protein